MSSAGSRLNKQLGFPFIAKGQRGKGERRVLFFTCVSQPQFCIQVIEHLHRELEPAGETPMLSGGRERLRGIWLS